MDEASANSLANLYQQVMDKSRDYDYDEITKKLRKGVDKPIEGENSSDAGLKPPKASKKKYTYVPESTDPDVNMEGNSAPENEFDPFDENVNDIAHKAENRRAYIKGKKTLKEVVDQQVHEYLNKQKEYRKVDSNRQRQEMYDNLAAKVRREAADIMKRKLMDTPPGKSPTNKRPLKQGAAGDSKAKTPTVARTLFPDEEKEEKEQKSSDDEDVKTEKKPKKLNPGIKKHYTEVIDTWSTAFGGKLYEEVRVTFQDAVNLRKGKQYFVDDAPKPSTKKRMSRTVMNQYKKELKEWLDGIFI